MFVITSVRGSVVEVLLVKDLHIRNAESNGVIDPPVRAVSWEWLNSVSSYQSRRRFKINTHQYTDMKTLTWSLQHLLDPVVQTLTNLNNKVEFLKCVKLLESEVFSFPNLLFVKTVHLITET